MTNAELEDLYLKSLDGSLTASEQVILSDALKSNQELGQSLGTYSVIRQMARHVESPTFGYHFAARVIAKIENTGVTIQREIFSFFRRYQLAAVGVVVALAVVNIALADQMTLTSIFGLESTSTVEQDIVPIDFYELLNDSL